MVRPAVIIIALIGALAAAGPSPAGQESAAGTEANLEDYAVRYDVENWPGKEGAVIAGVGPDDIFRGRPELLFDHDEWMETDGEWVVMRQFVTPGRELVVEVAVTGSCRSAHRVLYSHLSRQTAGPILPPPALPNGQVRIEDVGDVCFGVVQHGVNPYRRIEFVRNNVVVLLTVRPDSRLSLLSIAAEIDEYLLALPAYSEAQAAGRWISIDGFRADSAPDSGQPVTGALIPIELSVTVPSGDSPTRAWRMSAGGIVERDGALFYYAEAAGRQAITLLVSDPSGLSAHATIELVVTE